MARTLPPLNALRAFEAAGRHGSFTGAADELNVSHSAISRHVRGLEKRLGVQLFRTRSRGVELTAEGARYLAALTPAFDDIAAASEVFQAETEGKVTVNSDPMFAERWLIPRIGGFQDAHPKIDLQLVASDRLANLDQHEADMAVRFFLQGDVGDRAVLLSDTLVYPYASPKLWQPGWGARDLLPMKLLVDREGDPWTRWFRKAGLAEGEIPSVRRQWDAVLSLAAAIAGRGVMLTNPEIVEQEVADGRLVRCVDIGLSAGAYGLVFSEGARRRKAVRLFADWLLDQAKDLRCETGGGRNIQPKS